MDIQICQRTANSPMPCHLNHSCVTPTTGMPLKERVISRDPVSIVQLHLWMRLIGRFPIYREATDQPGPEMNSISNISQSSVTLPLQSHCATRLKLTVKKSFKNAPLAGFQDRKGTPFEHFRRVLSTNQKPGFRALDQSEASISAKFSASAKFEPTQCTATVPLQRHCVYFGKIFGFSKI